MYGMKRDDLGNSSGVDVVFVCLEVTFVVEHSCIEVGKFLVSIKKLT